MPTCYAVQDAQQLMPVEGAPASSIAVKDLPEVCLWVITLILALVLLLLLRLQQKPKHHDENVWEIISLKFDSHICT